MSAFSWVLLAIFALTSPLLIAWSFIHVLEWFKKPSGSIDQPPARTQVDVRRLDTPAEYWVSEVYYDAWGTPYVFDKFRKTLIISPGGKVRDYPYHTEWRLKTGPDVEFPENVSEKQRRGWHPNEI